jgi:hypothetical protein
VSSEEDTPKRDLHSLLSIARDRLPLRRCCHPGGQGEPQGPPAPAEGPRLQLGPDLTDVTEVPPATASAWRSCSTRGGVYPSED